MWNIYSIYDSPCMAINVGDTLHRIHPRPSGILPNTIEVVRIDYGGQWRCSSSKSPHRIWYNGKYLGGMPMYSRPDQWVQCSKCPHYTRYSNVPS